MVRFRLLPAAALALLTLIACVAVGCGGSSSSDNGVASKSPTEILTAAKNAAASASAVHVTGSLVSGGVPITIDLTLVSGEGGKGRISQNGLSFELIQVGGNAYISGSSAFYEHFAGAGAARLLQGKWLEASATSGNFATLGSFTDMHKLIETALTQRGTLTKGATTTVAGQAVVPIADTSQNGTLYVATTGKPYPVQISKSGAGGGSISFSGWDQPVAITAPKNAISLSELQHAGG